MTTLFNVYLRIHSPHGAFEFLITDEPREKAAADELMANCMGTMSRSTSRPLTMSTMGQGSKEMLVFPMEVLNQSVLRFYSMEVLAPAGEMDFGSGVSKTWRVDQGV